jgi:hypothetical protein
LVDAQRFLVSLCREVLKAMALQILAVVGLLG